ncbi:hypothetical protein BDQ17DRAFT_1357379 [Cyathus striatus]|nr:hypothetical protein BDQ17DRAFT_1357379 [Cyathus striatus]
MAEMTYEQLQQALFLLGPWLIGSFLDFLFQGVLFCQFVHYYQWNPNDKIGLKSAVAGLVLLTTLKTIQSFALIWILLILHFEDLPGAILLNYTTWWQAGSSLMVASIGLYVQIFFLHRLLVLTKYNWLMVAPIAVVIVFSYVSICVATHYIALGSDTGVKTGIWFANHLSSVFAGDFLITCVTAFYLFQTKKDVLPQTVGLISALVRLTFQTAAPAALCAMFNLVFSQLYSGDDKLISTAFNMALPKLYAFSMMWTLNARHSLRGGRYNSDPSSRNRHDNVELGAYTNNIQVHTHIETVQQIDVRDMFDHGGSDGDVKSHERDIKAGM